MLILIHSLGQDFMRSNISRIQASVVRTKGLFFHFSTKDERLSRTFLSVFADNESVHARNTSVCVSYLEQLHFRVGRLNGKYLRSLRQTQVCFNRNTFGRRATTTLTPSAGFPLRGFRPTATVRSIRSLNVRFRLL